MKFQETITFASVADLEAAMPTLARGQWIILDGAKGRVVGQGVSVWIAWSKGAQSRDGYSRMCAEFRNRYCPVAVNKAIEASNRHGRKISGREARAIHALLAGRH